MKSLRQIIREVNDNPDPKDIKSAVEEAEKSLVAAKREGMKGKKNKTEIEFYTRKVEALKRAKGEK